MPTEPWDEKKKNLCETCGGILDDDYFCTECGAENNYGSDADDYYVNLREES